MFKFKLKSQAVSNFSAAIAIHDEFIYFIEIDENHKPQRKVTVPLVDGAIVNGQIKNFSALKDAFVEIRKAVGKLNLNVCIGLPEGESIIRFVDLPDMSIEDVRGSLDLNFNEYFPYPREEAVFDIVRIQTPNAAHKNNITLLAAAARAQTVENILNAAHDAGIPSGPVEPFNFAMIRAIKAAYQGFCIIADHHNIVAVWNGDGIYFRTGDNHRSSQDILNTIRYIENQYRGAYVDRVILLGQGFEIFSDAASNSDSDDSAGPKIIIEPDEYYAATGLAMREEPGFLSLDMRPQKFIDMEHRRHAFNVNKLILSGLLMVFVLLSFGTMAYSVLCIHELNDKIALVRASVQDLTPQRIAILRLNSELEKQNTETEKVLKFLQDDIPVLEILSDIETYVGSVIKFDNADFTRSGAGGFVITLDGKAEDENAVIAMTDGLRNGGRYSAIKRPVSQQEQTGLVTFKIILEIGEVSSESTES